MLSAIGLHRWYQVGLFWLNRGNAPKPKGKFEELPPVTVQLPVFNEKHVTARLIHAVEKLDYPKEKLQIQILDDSTDETVDICRAEAARLKELGFDVEHIHRTDRTGFKAGALENGLRTAKAEYIFILDADFVPPPDILHCMIHFFTDEKVAVVQTRWGHLNRDYSLLTRVQALFLDGHLVVEQTARNRSGRFINFNGTGGMWRRSAIADAGGWQHDTLTEDLDLSYRAQLRGWKFVFLKDILTPSELPVELSGFKSQQHRWTKGSIQTCLKMLGTVWRSSQPLKVKVEATMHLCVNFTYLLLPLQLFLIFPGVGSGFHMGGWRVWLLDVPVFVLTSLSMGAFYFSSQLAGGQPRGWRNIIYFPVLMALLIGMSINNGKAVLEAVFRKESPFVRTPKYGIEKQGRAPLVPASFNGFKMVAIGMESALAVYFIFLVIFAILNNYWNLIPFLVLFMGGFCYVAAGSILQLLRNRPVKKNPSSSIG